MYFFNKNHDMMWDNQKNSDYMYYVLYRQTEVFGKYHI